MIGLESYDNFGHINAETGLTGIVLSGYCSHNEEGLISVMFGCLLQHSNIRQHHNRNCINWKSIQTFRFIGQMPPSTKQVQTFVLGSHETYTSEEQQNETKEKKAE